jgi:hypothetical protein
MNSIEQATEELKTLFRELEQAEEDDRELTKKYSLFSIKYVQIEKEYNDIGRKRKLNKRIITEISSRIRYLNDFIENIKNSSYENFKLLSETELDIIMSKNMDNLVNITTEVLKIKKLYPDWVLDNIEISDSYRDNTDQLKSSYKFRYMTQDGYYMTYENKNIDQLQE